MFRLGDIVEREIKGVLKIQVCDSEMVLWIELKNTGRRANLGGGVEEDGELKSAI